MVIDHDSGRSVWAAPGRDRKTLQRFFDALGAERCRQITLVSADAAAWIAAVVAERCLSATPCTDPFHVVSWATDALDEMRRETWNDARRDGQKAVARELNGFHSPDALIALALLSLGGYRPPLPGRSS